MSQLVMCNADRCVMRCGLMVNVFRQSEEYDDSKQLTAALVSLSRVEWQQARVEYHRVYSTLEGEELLEQVYCRRRVTTTQNLELTEMSVATV